MYRLDIAIVALVVYLGLSAWAYRDVGVRKSSRHAAHEPTRAVVHRTHASYAQIAASVVAICLGAFFIVSGAGLMLRGWLGMSDWTLLTLGSSYPASDVVTGIVMLLLGGLVVYETRYSVIKHPRPPRKMSGRSA